ncbi:MAG: AbrB/MazE/SpoVT family DNA-binding domain-containing protein [Candidatus Eisenbacteria sp.]|nr:AbrB/MazE/SpoVT family DNA-binding domain-containing protein [Candidatus Eisenbacteria bacterium]
MEQDFATTKMSSRGQVVIPESIRSEMGLEPGSRFVVMWHGDVVMLKVISPPSLEEFNTVQKRLQQATRKAGLKRKDIAKAVAKVRRRS